MPEKSRCGRGKVSGVPLKLFGAALLVLAGIGGGWLYARQLTVRRSFLTSFLTFLSNLATGLRYRGERMELLINSSGELFSLPVGNREQSVAEVWSAQISNFPKKWRLTAQDMTLLEEFGAKLGSTDTEGQLAHISLYQALFQKQLGEAERDVKQKAKLYQTLGLFIGVSAALMMW